MTQHPAEREAERLRTILQSFADVDPYMPLRDAVPAIFETEKKAAKLERQQVETEGRTTIFELPNDAPETIASWIDLNPKVGSEIVSGNKIQAIKDVRAACRVGLKEAKDGVEAWAARGKAPATTKKLGTTPHEIASWIDFSAPSIQTLIRDGKRIQAIREVRFTHPSSPGLREAKDGVETWAKDYGY